ncbi:MAG: cation diffusion facilitator family transporter [Rickettsiales bacterium]
MGIGHHHHHIPSVSPEIRGTVYEEDARLMRLATYASVGMASALIILKTIAWWMSDSLSMLSSLTDSFFDVLTSIMNLIALRYALKPADDDHRFGHTRIEDIVGLAQCACIVASMLIIMLQSFERLSNPEPMTHSALGIGVSIIAMIATGILVLFQGYVAKRTKSLIVASDRLHYVGDVLFNLGVIVALVLTSISGWLWADPAMAILMALAIIYSSKDLGLRAYNNLMDKEMPDSEKAKIYAVLESMPEVRGHHNLKTRYAGNKPFMQMHIDIDASLSFKEAHDIVDRLENKLMETFPGAEVIIHPDPL